ncbi:sulfite exporter TauE/SafE family protein [Rubritalea sp.]|uniref:sulfite exporter TauE/SafE family protein n=1 Tax=Rubritalea sp. TaxID=2109375 RepID=UPI003EFB0F35
MKIILTSLIVGACAGLLGALCGIGGGIVMVPAFTQILGVSHKQAIATSLAIIIITAVAATANNSKAGLVDWRIVAAAALGAAAAAWWGSDLMQSLQSTTLTRIFGVTLLVFGAKMLIKP